MFLCFCFFTHLVFIYICRFYKLEKIIVFIFKLKKMKLKFRRFIKLNKMLILTISNYIHYMITTKLNKTLNNRFLFQLRSYLSTILFHSVINLNVFLYILIKFVFNAYQQCYQHDYFSESVQCLFIFITVLLLL